MRKIKATHFLSCLTLTLTMLGMNTLDVMAQGVPSVMPYQGFLQDAQGAPVDGLVSITVKLYEESLAGAPIWEETIAGTQVQGGAFSLNLGEISTNLNEYLYTGRARYVGVSVNNGPELTPRTKIGSLPYAFMAYNAYRFDGRPASDFVTQEQLTNVVGAGLSEDDVNALIDARGYLNTAAIEALIDGRSYLNEAAVEALIDNRGYLTEAAIVTLITNILNGRDYLSSDEIDQRIAAAVAVIDARVTTVDARVTTVDGDLTQLEQTVTALTARIVALEAQVAAGVGGLPFILGPSNHSDNGWFEFNGHQGLRAAGEACKATYPNDPTAHFCSISEVQSAVSVGNYNEININNVEVWLGPSWSKNDGGFVGDADFCQSLLYHSGHAATGTSLTVLTNAGSTSGGAGVRFAFNDAKNCQNSLKVLCCRY